MSRVVWFNCAAGVAGDMVLAALIDAGADRLAVMDAWAALDLEGDAFAATWERVQRCGVSALWTNLAVHREHRHESEHGEHHPHRPASDVLDLIARADLGPHVRDQAIGVYRTLAAVEGSIHGQDPDAVELHEVGALDSILDVVGVCAALRTLNVDQVTYSPIAVGHGTVTTAHGELPNPVPAVTALLARVGAPAAGIDTTMELSTPTGVALLTVLGAPSSAMPAMSVESTGFGAGTADPAGRPNVVQAVVGRATKADAGGSGGLADGGRPAYVLEANVDDVTGEILGHAIASLLGAGAYDAWVTAIVMKKGRPAHTVHALCDDATMAAVRSALVAETGTLGVRATPIARWPQRREECSVDVEGHPIRVKVADHRIKVEFDDAAAAARALSRPVRDVIAEAESLVRASLSA